MSWVSYNKLNEFGKAIRNKFISNEIVVADADKTKGVHLNIGGQDGLLAMSPLNEDDVTPAALWVTDSEANNATELTGGTLSYVTDNGKDTEDYTSLSLVGGVVNVSGKGGAQRRITNVATPTSENDVATKKYVDDNARGIISRRNAYLTLPSASKIYSTYTEIADLTSILPSNSIGMAVVNLYIGFNGDCIFSSKVTEGSSSTHEYYGAIPYTAVLKSSDTAVTSNICFSFDTTNSNTYKLFARVSPVAVSTDTGSIASISGYLTAFYNYYG